MNGRRDLVPVLCGFKRKPPEHPVLRLVEAMFGRDDAPEAGVLPATCGEFIKKRNSMFCFDGA